MSSFAVLIPYREGESPPACMRYKITHLTGGLSDASPSRRNTGLACDRDVIVLNGTPPVRKMTRSLVNGSTAGLSRSLEDDTKDRRKVRFETVQILVQGDEPARGRGENIPAPIVLSNVGSTGAADRFPNWSASGRS